VDQFFKDNPAGTSEPAKTAPVASALGGSHAFAHHVFADLPIVGSSINWAAQNLLAHFAAGVRGTSFDDELAKVKAFDEGSDVANPTAAGAGTMTAKVLGYTAAGALAPEAFAGSGVVTSMGKSALTSGIIEGIDALTQGKDPQEALKAAGYGAAGGAAGPLIGKGLGWIFSNAIEPNVLRLASSAQNMGIRLSADLVSNNPLLRLVKKLPGYGGHEGRGLDASRAQWRAAVAREIGVTDGADTFLPATMDAAKVNNHNLFQSVANQAQDIRYTPRYQTIMQDIHDDIVTPGGMSPVWKKGEARRALDLLDYVAKPFRQGNVNGPWRISPQQYLEMTEGESGLGHWIGTAAGRENPNLERIAAKLKNGLDDMLQGQLPQSAADNLARARQQWWAMRTVEPLAEANRATGIIPPEELARVVAANTKNFAFGGGGRLGDLADIGGLFLKSKAAKDVDKGTLIKWLLQAGGGAAAGFLHSGIWGSGIVASGVGLLAPALARGAGMVARSPAVGNALVSAARGTPGIVGRALPAVGRGMVRAGSVGAAPTAVPAAAGAYNYLTQPEAPAP
jgi:hypothetical protein